MMDPNLSRSAHRPTPRRHSTLRAVRAAISRLWNAPRPNARFLVVSGSFWTVNLALTEPYRFLFFSRLGLSPEAIGKLFAADLAIRSLGLLFSGATQRAFGAKRMLVAADIVSWVLPYVVLGFSTRPWHAVVAVLLTSLNAFASTPYNCLIAEGMPASRRTRAYSFMVVWNTAPMLLVPWIAGWLVSRGDFGATLRALFLLQAACMAAGIAWRARRLVDLDPSHTSSPHGLFTTFRQILSKPGFLPSWGALAAQGLATHLSNAFLAVFLTHRLHLSDAFPGWVAQATTAGLVLGTLGLQPRLREAHAPAIAAIAVVLAALATAGYCLDPGPLGVLAIAGTGGLCGALSNAATSALLTTNLPRNARDHGFALSYVGVHLAGAAAMPLAGSFLESDLGRYPLLAMAVLLAWAACLWACRTPRA